MQTHIACYRDRVAIFLTMMSSFSSNALVPALFLLFSCFVLLSSYSKLCSSSRAQEGQVHDGLHLLGEGQDHQGHLGPGGAVASINAR